MVVPRYLLDMANGQFVVSRPGYDATSPSLTDEQTAFSTRWSETLNAARYSWDATINGAGWITYNPLDVLPLTACWRRQTAQNIPNYSNTGTITGYNSAIVTYTNTSATIEGARISPRSNGNNFAYLSLNNPADKTDDREVGPLQWRFLYGTHPTRGPGIFIARRGSNVLTCPDDDLLINTSRSMLQIAEAGRYSAIRRVVSKLDTNELQQGYSDIVNLSGSYPDHPPVFVTFIGIGQDNDKPSTVQVHWITDSSFRIRVWNEQRLGNFPAVIPIQWSIPRLNPTMPSTGSTLTWRWRLNGTDGLRVSNPDVDVRTATNAQSMFSSDFPMLRIKGRGVIVTTTRNQKGLLTVPALDTSLCPLMLFSIYYNGSWTSSVGYISISGATAWMVGNRQIAFDINYSGTTLRWAIIDFAQLT